MLFRSQMQLRATLGNASAIYLDARRAMGDQRPRSIAANGAQIQLRNASPMHLSYTKEDEVEVLGWSMN